MRAGYNEYRRRSSQRSVLHDYVFQREAVRCSVVLDYHAQRYGPESPPSIHTDDGRHRCATPRYHKLVLSEGNAVNESAEVVSELSFGDLGDVFGDLGVCHGGIVQRGACPVVTTPLTAQRVVQER